MKCRAVPIVATSVLAAYLAAFGWPLPVAAVLAALSGFLIGKAWSA